jgi:hypothetical protein
MAAAAAWVMAGLGGCRAVPIVGVFGFLMSVEQLYVPGYHHFTLGQTDDIARVDASLETGCPRGWLFARWPRSETEGGDTGGTTRGRRHRGLICLQSDVGDGHSELKIAMSTSRYNDYGDSTSGISWKCWEIESPNAMAGSNLLGLPHNQKHPGFSLLHYQPYEYQQHADPVPIPISHSPSVLPQTPCNAHEPVCQH